MITLASNLKKSSLLTFIFSLALVFAFSSPALAGLSVGNFTGSVLVLDENGNAKTYNQGDKIPALADGSSVHVLTGTAQIIISPGTQVVINRGGIPEAITPSASTVVVLQAGDTIDSLGSTVSAEESNEAT